MAWTQPTFGKMTQKVYKPATNGMVDVFIGPQSLAWNAGFGKNHLFRYLGRVVQGSARNDFSRTYYDLATGLPGTVKESFVTGIEGKLECTLMEPSGLLYSILTANGILVPKYRAVPVTTTQAAAGTTKVVKVASNASFAVGDDIRVLTNTGGVEYTSVIGKASTTDLEVYPELQYTPDASGALNLVDGWKVVAGSTIIQRYSLLTVFNQPDGGQIITHMPDVRCDGVFKEDYADGTKEMQLPMSFTGFGTDDADSTGPIIAAKYILKSAAALSYDNV